VIHSSSMAYVRCHWGTIYKHCVCVLYYTTSIQTLLYSVPREKEPVSRPNCNRLRAFPTYLTYRRRGQSEGNARNGFLLSWHGVYLPLRPSTVSTTCWFQFSSLPLCCERRLLTIPWNLTIAQDLVPENSA